MNLSILYDVGESEKLKLYGEMWHYEQSALNANTSDVTFAPKVIENEPLELQKFMEYFGNMPFLRHQAQGFEHYVLIKAYDAEEEALWK